MSPIKKIILGLFVSSLIGYLEWGNQRQFIAEIEFNLLLKITQTVEAFIHPLVLLPLLGQSVLLISFLLPKPKIWLVIIASTGIALLFLMLLLIGLLNSNLKITCCSLPFLVFYGLLITRRKSLNLGN
jgi:hypothetical protein